MIKIRYNEVLIIAKKVEELISDIDFNIEDIFLVELSVEYNKLSVKCGSNSFYIINNGPGFEPIIRTLSLNIKKEDFKKCVRKIVDIVSTRILKFINKNFEDQKAVLEGHAHNERRCIYLTKNLCSITSLERDYSNFKYLSSMLVEDLVLALSIAPKNEFGVSDWTRWSWIFISDIPRDSELLDLLYLYCKKNYNKDTKLLKKFSKFIDADRILLLELEENPYSYIEEE